MAVKLSQDSPTANWFAKLPEGLWNFRSGTYIMLTILLQMHTAIASISHCEQSEQCREAEAPRPCHSPSASPPYTRPLTFMSRGAGDRGTRERTACASYALLSPHFSDLSSTGLPRDPHATGGREEHESRPGLCSIHPSVVVDWYQLTLHPIAPLITIVPDG